MKKLRLMLSEEYSTWSLIVGRRFSQSGGSQQVKSFLTVGVKSSQMWKRFCSGWNILYVSSYICVNSDDSCICKCRVGYVLNADRKTCSRKHLICFSMHVWCLWCHPASQIFHKAPNLELQNIVHQCTNSSNWRVGAGEERHTTNVVNIVFHFWCQHE